MKRVIQTVVSVIFIGLIIEISAPVLDEKYALSGYLKSLLDNTETEKSTSLVKSSHKSIYYEIPNDWLFVEVSKRTPGTDELIEELKKTASWLNENYDMIEKINSPKKKIYLYAGQYPYLQVNENTIEKTCAAADSNLQINNSNLVSCYLNDIVLGGREQYSMLTDNPFGVSELKRFFHRFYIEDLYYVYYYDCPKNDCDDVKVVSDNLLKSIRKK